MKNKVTAFFTNELSPDEHAQVEARVGIDPELATEFEFQASIFDALEAERLRFKIKKIMAEERLRKARQQKWLKIGGAAGTVLWIAVTCFYVSQVSKNQRITPLEKAHLVKTDSIQVHQVSPKETPVVQEQPLIIPQLQPQLQVRPKKLSRVAAPQQGLQPAQKILRPNDSIFAVAQPFPSQDAAHLVVGAHSDTNSHVWSMSTRPTIDCDRIERRLTQKHQQPLSPKAKQLLEDYCAGKSPNPVIGDGRFNTDLAWLMKAVYNIDKKMNGSAQYCLDNIKSDSDFLLEKQFCEALIHPTLPIKADFVKIFEQDTSSLFHEKAKDLLEK